MESTTHYIKPSSLDLLIEDDEDFSFDEDYMEEIMEDINAKIRAWDGFSTLRRGDVLCFHSKENRYRNTSCMMWNGAKVVHLDYTDEYGNVIRELKVTDTEFHPRYWCSSIWHNGIFWLSDELVRRLTFTKAENGTISSPIKIGDKTWTCIVDDVSSLPEKLLKNLDALPDYILKTQKNERPRYVFNGHESEYCEKYDWDSTFFLFNWYGNAADPVDD